MPRFSSKTVIYNKYTLTSASSRFHILLRNQGSYIADRSYLSHNHTSLGRGRQLTSYLYIVWLLWFNLISFHQLAKCVWKTGVQKPASISNHKCYNIYKLQNIKIYLSSIDIKLHWNIHVSTNFLALSFLVLVVKMKIRVLSHLCFDVTVTCTSNPQTKDAKLRFVIYYIYFFCKVNIFLFIYRE